jgi:signal transduction histidine kinase
MFLGGQRDSIFATSLLKEMVSVMDDLQTEVSRIMQAAKPPNSSRLEPIRLEEVWRDAISLLSERMKRARVTCRLVGGSTIEGNRQQLMFAFAELLMNSLDAFSSSTIKTLKRAISIRISPSPKSGATTIIYSDSGPGFDRRGADLDTIFSPDYTPNQNRGGLGLYLVRKVISEHGGVVAAIGNRLGAVFKITIGRASRNEC